MQQFFSIWLYWVHVNDLELSNLHRRAKLIALQNMFSYCIIPASLILTILTEIFLTLKRKWKSIKIVQFFLILTRNTVSHNILVSVSGHCRTWMENQMWKIKRLYYQAERGVVHGWFSAWEPVINGVLQVSVLSCWTSLSLVWCWQSAFSALQMTPSCGISWYTHRQGI